MPSIARVSLWLDTDWLLSQFGQDRERAIAAYRDFVAAGRNSLSPLRDVSHQFLLGDSGFSAKYLNALARSDLDGIPRMQRKLVALPLARYFELSADRDEAITRAYQSTAYSMTEIARYLGVSIRSVSRAIHRMEEKGTVEVRYHDARH